MWDRFIATARRTAPAVTGRSRRSAAQHYKLYLARASAVGREPWITPWEGPAT